MKKHCAYFDLLYTKNKQTPIQCIITSKIFRQFTQCNAPSIRELLCLFIQFTRNEKKSLVEKLQFLKYSKYGQIKHINKFFQPLAESQIFYVKLNFVKWTLEISLKLIVEKKKRKKVIKFQNVRKKNVSKQEAIMKSFIFFGSTSLIQRWFFPFCSWIISRNMNLFLESYQ